MKDQKTLKQNSAFGERMRNIINDGALALMIGIGHQTGLFDTMASLPPATSEEIASAAKLNERYTREWLAAMVSGQIVEYAPDEQRYSLPPEHAGFLTREVGGSNMAGYAQTIAMLAEVEQPMVHCFKGGGGIPYAEYSALHRVFENADVSDFDNIIENISSIPGVSESLKRGIKVADMGCGTGGMLITMAKLFPNSRFVGYDFSNKSIEIAIQQVRKESLHNVQFEVMNLEDLHLPSTYDMITSFTVIHDLAKPKVVLSSIFRALKNQGMLIMTESAASRDLENNVNYPWAPMSYTFSCMHCIPVSFALDGEGLGSMWSVESVLQYLEEVGFINIETKPMMQDDSIQVFIARTGNSGSVQRS